jgi:hypothetical protein
MKAVQKVFNLFSGNPKNQSISQMKEHKISGELYKKSIGNNLLLLSNDITMFLTQEDPSVMEYDLEINNIGPKTDGKIDYLS